MSWYCHKYTLAEEERELNMKMHDLLEGPHDRYNDKAVFMCGGPGSGKSFVAQRLLDGTGLKMVNSDIVYEYLMKKNNLGVDQDSIASDQGQEIRNRAKYLASKKRGNYLRNQLGLIIDGTGRDFGVVAGTKYMLESEGYSTAMVFVNASLEVALERNNNRLRSVPEVLVKKYWRDVQLNLSKYQGLFGANNFVIVDNSERDSDFSYAQKTINRFLNS